MQDNEFECDDRKAAHNAREHGVTFEKPRAALDNPDNVEEYDPDPDKERCSRLCRLEQDVFVVVYT
ncbi:MAG TPA: BrnT family toxin, partial [Hyphomicrobiaceae bacterium]|nr:BrnT family toxin [Hyphomicrobiaceae bacterium]